MKPITKILTLSALAAGAISILDAPRHHVQIPKGLHTFVTTLPALSNQKPSATPLPIPDPLTSPSFPFIPLCFTPPQLEDIASSYQQLRTSIHQHQQALSEAYDQTDTEEAAIITQARTYVLDTLINKIFPAWYGTPWDFNGTAQVPHHGVIACGYFVSTTLEHAGFNLERVSLAQQASQYIIKSLVHDTKNIKTVCCAKPMETFLATVRSMGSGLYIVGLDHHVGFIINESGTVSFCHSDYTKRWYGVDREEATASRALTGSRYKIIAKILDDGMMEDWLTRAKIATVREQRKR